MDNIAYKILTAAECAALQAGAFNGAPADLADGYIHLSTASQLDETAAKHFSGQTKLYIAAVDLAALGEKIRWEVSRNDALFPHLYGRLEASAILSIFPLTRRQDGSIDLSPQSAGHSSG